MIASGVLSLAFGFYLAYQIGVVDGLFTGDFHWDPAQARSIAAHEEARLAAGPLG